MADTLAQKLDRVQATIAEVEEHGQSITEEGQTFNRANLKTLYEREERLLRQIDLENRGRLTMADF